MCEVVSRDRDTVGRADSLHEACERRGGARGAVLYLLPREGRRERRWREARSCREETPPPNRTFLEVGCPKGIFDGAMPRVHWRWVLTAPIPVWLRPAIINPLNTEFPEHVRSCAGHWVTAENMTSLTDVPTETDNKQVHRDVTTVMKDELGQGVGTWRVQERLCLERQA